MRVRGVLGTLAIAGMLLTGGSAKADPNVGCGLGTQLLEGKDGLVMQVLAATTNSIFMNQTFGISSNTLGCKRDQVVTAQHRVNMFTGANFDQLARDMATGRGEALTTLAVLMEIDEPDRAAFYQLTKDNFVALYPADDVTSGDLLETLEHLMAESPELNRYVQS